MQIALLFLILFFVVPLSAEIQGIFVTSEKNDIVSEGRALSGIQVQDLELDPASEEEFKKVLTPFLGKETTSENLIGLKQAIINYYVATRHSRIDVSMPSQKSTVVGTVVQILVIEKAFGKSVYKGQIWYSDAEMNQYLAIKPGKEISEDTLQNNLSWLNRNPFHYTEVRYVPSLDPTVDDLEFMSRTRRPLRFYTRADDTGNKVTGYGIFAGGLSWGNAFGIGDLLSYEYACSNEFDRYQSNTVTYTSFFSWQHFFNFFYNHSVLKPQIPNSTVTAKIQEALFYYNIPFKPLYTDFQQSMIFGFEWKNTNSNFIAIGSGGGVQIEITGAVPVIQELNIGQFYVNYTVSDTINKNKVAFSLDTYASPGDLLSHQTNADFQAQRPYSKNKYYYTFLTFSEIYTEPKKYSLCFLLRGQISNNTLPPTELFSLGGFNTVRGYHEAELNTDNGFIFNFEVRSAPRDLKLPEGSNWLCLWFVDYGLGNNWHSPVVPGVTTAPNSQYLLGTGPGMRYTYNPYVQVRLDWGFKLHHLFSVGKVANQLVAGFGQIHVGALLSY